MGRAPVGISPSTIMKLRQQAAGNFGLNAETDPTKVTAEMPSPVSYGVFGNSYAQSLAAKAQDPYFGGGYDAALRDNAEQESRDYDRRLAAANEQALLLQQRAAKYGLFKQQMETQGGSALPGEFSVGNDGLEIDPVIQAVHRTNEVNKDIAGNHKTEAEAAAALYSAGVKPDVGDVNAAQGNPVFGTPAKYGVFPNQIAPDDAAKQKSADAAMLSAEANMIDAKNPLKYSKSGGAGGGTTFSIIQPIPGVGMVTTKTKDPTVIDKIKNKSDTTATPGIQRRRQQAAAAGWREVSAANGVHVFSNGRDSLKYDSNGAPLP